VVTEVHQERLRKVQANSNEAAVYIVLSLDADFRIRVWQRTEGTLPRLLCALSLPSQEENSMALLYVAWNLPVSLTYVSVRQT